LRQPFTYLGLAGLSCWHAVRLKRANEARDLRRAKQLQLTLDHLNQGICMFDGEMNVVFANHRYAELYDLAPEHVTPGTPLRQILEARAAKGFYNNIDAQKFINDGISNFHQSVSEILHLADGRFVSVQRRPLANGGVISTHEDVTERQSLSARLEENNRLLRERTSHLQAIVDNFPGGITFTDKNLRVVVANEKVKELLDLPERLFANGPPAVEDILRFNAERGEYGAGDLEEIVATRLALGKQGKPHMSERERPDGTIVEVRGVPLASGGNVTIYLDMTERRRAESRIAHMAHHDALTDLPNRLLLQDRLEQALARLPMDERLAVFCLDLDGFKTVNDTLGHPVGDTLLKAVAERLRACVRKSDTVARFGGDEFAILQIAIDGLDDVTALAERIIQSIHTPYDLDHHHVNVGISIGIAVAPNDGVDPNQLLKNADLALYRAKAEGRGSYDFFELEMDVRMRARRELELDLRRALGDGQFELYYQPLVNLQRDEVCGFEALLRWHHPSRGMVSPVEFVPVAEDIGLIVPIGEWALRHACVEAAVWPCRPRSLRAKILCRRL